MLVLAFAVVSAVMALPKEFHVDCSSWPGAVAVEIDFRFTPVEGKCIDTGFEMQPKTDPIDVRQSLERRLRGAGWRYRVVGKNILVIEGSKDSPIQSVVFTSQGWKPDVRMVFLPPDKK